MAETVSVSNVVKRSDTLVAAGILLHRLGVDHDIFARQILRHARLALTSWTRPRRWRRRGGRIVIVVVRVEAGEQQLQLTAIELLALSAKQPLEKKA